MANSPDGLPKNLADSFKELKAAAVDLNAVSDTLASPITALDAALKRLNLGVPAWMEFESYVEENDTGQYDSTDIGYAKIRGDWGIAIRRRIGNEYSGNERSEEWLFNDAPRQLRVRAVDHLPKVIEALIKEARSTADKIMQKIGQAEQFAEAVTGVQRKAPPAQGRK